MVTRRRISVELEFDGNGSIVESAPGVFRGGVTEPTLGDDLSFSVLPAVLDENSIYNPLSGAATVEGGFQVNVWGTSRGFRELGRYLLAIAELDSSADSDYHEHLELQSADGRTRCELILRKVSE